MEDMLDWSERGVRDLVRTIPDGDYAFADYIDDDFNGDPSGWRSRFACATTRSRSTIPAPIPRSMGRSTSLPSASGTLSCSRGSSTSCSARIPTSR